MEIDVTYARSLTEMSQLLAYIVEIYGKEIYTDCERLVEFIEDLYSGEERVKRIYKRAIMDDHLSLQIHGLQGKEDAMRKAQVGALIVRFTEANFLTEAMGTMVVNAFVDALFPISTKATPEDGEWTDEFGVVYSTDKMKLIKFRGSWINSYRVLDGTKVICDYAFEYCTSLTSITLPDSLTSIGKSAFEGCRNLCKVICEWNNLYKVTVGSNVFNDFYLGYSLYIPKGTKAIYERADPWKNFKSIFEYVQIITIGSIEYSLKKGEGTIVRQDMRLSGNIEIPEFVTYDGASYTVTSVEDQAFRNTKITSIKLPRTITKLSSYCFKGCTSLTSVDLPDSIKSLGDGCFWCCSSLTHINLPESIKSLGDECFGSCHNLIAINLPNSITTLGEHSFYSCDSLSSITLPESITELGEGCFWNCHNLTSIHLPDNITKLGNSCFEDCTSLTAIITPNNILKLRNKCFFGCSLLRFIDLSDSITTLGDRCFEGCDSHYKVICRWTDLDQVTAYSNIFSVVKSECTLYIPKGTKSIYKGKDPWKYFLYIVELDDAKSFDGEIATIDGIGYYLRNGEATIIKQEKGLSGDIVIPANVTYNSASFIVTSVSDYAFVKTQITSIKLPNSIKELGSRCFKDCSNLTSINLPDNIKSLGDGCFAYCCNLNSIELPNSITELGNGCFSGCRSLVSIPQFTGITMIPSYCFAGCDGFTSITLSDSIIELGDECFAYCCNLNSIELPNSITELGNGCFKSCTSLTSVILPDAINSLRDKCFYNCYSLASITLPDGITSLGDACFSDCRNLVSVSLPISIIQLGNSCFDRCKSLTSVVLPNNITSLGSYCFCNCYNLTSIVLSNSITTLGNNCFNSCYSLSKVICGWNNLDEVYISYDVFKGIDSNCALYVPKGTKYIYNKKYPLNSFRQIFELDNQRANNEEPQS